MAHISIYLDEEYAERLEQISVSLGRSVEDLARAAVEDAIISYDRGRASESQDRLI